MASLFKQLLQPVALVWVVFIALTAWHLYRRQRRLAAVNGAMVLILFLLGSTPLSHMLMGSLEQPYLEKKLDDNVTADAVLVLGGFTEGGGEELMRIDAAGAFDRVLTGIELMRRGKAQHFYLGGGWVDLPDGERVPDHEVMAPWIDSWELLDVPVQTLGICVNTHGEAVATKKLMDEKGWEKIILVTSAWHMRRAEAVFRSAGVEVIPVVCDYKSLPRGGLRLIPDAGRLGNVHVYLKEKIGWFWYRSRGWIRLEALPE